MEVFTEAAFVTPANARNGQGVAPTERYDRKWEDKCWEGAAGQLGWDGVLAKGTNHNVPLLNINMQHWDGHLPRSARLPRKDLLDLPPTEPFSWRHNSNYPNIEDVKADLAEQFQRM